ncbi:MAG TPA: GNAT family N-acetyltransferase [Allocoleopsis sp.]
MKHHIALAQSIEELSLCFPVVQELRTHLTRDEFLVRVQRQQQQCGYQIVFLHTDSIVKSIAGFRLSECLAFGKFLYVDDLVTRAEYRSQGYGETLFDWLIDYAKFHNCNQLHLDSGVQRFDAHRFYLKKRMNISSHHFSMDLNSL